MTSPESTSNNMLLVALKAQELLSESDPQRADKLNAIIDHAVDTVYGRIAKTGAMGLTDRATVDVDNNLF